jgi:3-deoxy-D-manno-octulosonic acid (KDO) 8-phosphate synthase
MDMSISDFISDKASPLLLISGPCVIENHAITFEIAFNLRDLVVEMGSQNTPIAAKPLIGH